MTKEAIRIKRWLATSKARKAYEEAKAIDQAYIMIGNSIYRVKSDGTKEKIKELAGPTWVKARIKEFTI